MILKYMPKISNNGFYSVFISDDIRDDLNLSLDDFKIHAENKRIVDVVCNSCNYSGL